MTNSASGVQAVERQVESADRVSSTRRVKTILFVCQFNSARSQLAEALARSISPAGARWLSAGLTRTVVNDEVLRALSELKLDASRQWSKSLADVRDESVDVVISLADEVGLAARQSFPNALHLDWSMPDPIATQNRNAIAQAVRSTRDELRQRLLIWIQKEDNHAHKAVDTNIAVDSYGVADRRSHRIDDQRSGLGANDSRETN